MQSEDEVRTGVKVRCLFSFSRFGGRCQMRRNAWAPTKCYQFYLFGSLSSNHSLGLHVYFCPNYSSTNFLTFSILFHNLSAHRSPNQVMVLPHQQLDLWLVLCGGTGGGVSQIIMRQYSFLGKHMQTSNTIHSWTKSLLWYSGFFNHMLLCVFVCLWLFLRDKGLLCILAVLALLLLRQQSSCLNSPLLGLQVSAPKPGANHPTSDCRFRLISLPLKFVSFALECSMLSNSAVALSSCLRWLSTLLNLLNSHSFNRSALPSGGGGFSMSQDQDGKPHTPTVSSVTAPASSLPLQELAFVIPCNFVA